MTESSRSQRAQTDDAATLRRTLEAELNQYPLELDSVPFIVLLSGLPGTGKSHFARELSLRLPFVIVGSDRMRKALVPNPQYDRSEHSRVFNACHRLIEELLREGYRVIFDATNLNDGFRSGVYDIAQRTRCRLSLVRFTAPQEVVRQRLDARSSGQKSDSHSDADWLIYCRLRPGEEPIQRRHLTVDSSQDISPALDEVLRAVDSSAG